MASRDGKTSAAVITFVYDGKEVEIKLQKHSSTWDELARCLDAEFSDIPKSGKMLLVTSDGKMSVKRNTWSKFIQEHAATSFKLLVFAGTKVKFYFSKTKEWTRKINVLLNKFQSWEDLRERLREEYQNCDDDD